MADKIHMDVSSIAAAGLDVAQSRFEKAATGLASTADATSSPPDTVSLSQQALSLLSAKNEFSTDARLAHVGDEMQKTTLHMMA